MMAFDAVLDSQRVFRCLLEAAANPGKLYSLVPAYPRNPIEAVAKTLLDHEVTFCVSGGESGIEEKLSSCTGARAVPPPEADFAFVYETDRTASKLRRGELERPERGATAIYAVERLSNEASSTLTLSGPGVPGERGISVIGLPASEVGAIIENRADYPLGVDVYLVDEAGWVAGLPRSTRLEVKT